MQSSVRSHRTRHKTLRPGVQQSLHFGGTYLKFEPTLAVKPMYTSARHVSDPEVRKLRRMAGLWLKELRDKRGLSQRGLADLVGAEYYTFISQLENGHGRIPPDRYADWAAALAVPAAEFVRTLMQYYDPMTYEILFAGSPTEDHKRRQPADPVKV
jgi:transcriptional regulator with XRE-family HTH domain